MLVVLAISTVDYHLALPLSELIRDFGGVKNYPCLVVWDSAVSNEQRQPVLDNLREAFAKVNQLEPVLGPQDTGWPDGPNRMFATASHYVSQFTQGPWFWMESDVCPLRSTWLDEWAEEYRNCGKPLMGFLQTSFIEPMPGYKMPAGKHLAGTAVYPANLLQYTNSHLNCPGKAFDVAMQFDVVDGGHAAHTEKLSHNWLTANYRRDENGYLVGTPVEGRIKGQIGYSLSHPVDTKVACMLHGCKDTSLIKLLQAERQPKKRSVKRKGVVA